MQFVLVGLVCVPIEHFVTIDEPEANPKVYARFDRLDPVAER